MGTRPLLLRVASTDSHPTWEVNPEVPDSGVLQFAANLFEWIERYLEIRNKEGDIVPLRFNTIQVLLCQYVAWCWNKGIPVKIVLPKSRQMGTSTWAEALGFGLAELMPGYRVGIVAHTDEGATTIFDKVRVFSKQLRLRRDWHGPNFEVEQKAYRKWVHESSIDCATVKTGDGLGKGDTLNMLHCSESANFSDKGINAKKTISSIMQTVADTRWTIEVHESTAKGKDPYYYPMCEEARDPDSGSTRHLIFLPWFLEDGYNMNWTQYRKRIRLTGGKDPGQLFKATPEEERLREKLATQKVYKHERHYRYQYKLSDQQLIWRRWAIANKCEGDIDEFKRYYPSFYEECFTASASCMFDVPTINHYRAQGAPPLARGSLEATHRGPMFLEETKGPLQIWRPPERDREYVIGVDPGGEKVQSDPYNAYVLDSLSHEVVALVAGHFEWDEFSDLIELVGQWYNWALLVVENNHRPAIAKRLHRHSYRNLYYYVDLDQLKAGQGKTPGFNTNRKTRPPLCSRIRRECRSRTVTNPDPGFWREMEDFVWVPKPGSDNPDREGEYRAVGTNHDDKIMSLALALSQCPEAEDGVLSMPEMEIKPSRAYLMHLKLVEEEANDERAAAGEYLNLGVKRDLRDRVQSAWEEATWHA